MYRRTLLIPGLCLVLCGCQTGRPQKEERQLAEKRFHHQKAKIKYLLAMDQFQNGQITKAKQSLEEAIVLHADDQQYYLLLAKIYIEQGELAQANHLLDGMAVDAIPSAELCYLSGVVAERYGRLDEAMNHYRQAHELDPRRAGYAMAYGEMLISLNRAEQAWHLIVDCLDDIDDHARLQALMGEALHLLGQYEQSAMAYRRALVEFPDDDSLLESYAMALYRAGRYADAIVPLGRLYAKLRDQAPLYTVKALARSCLEVGQYSTALSYLWDFVRREPEDVQAWLMLARCHVALENLAAAKQAAERATELSPHNGDAQTMLGFVLSRQEDWPAARRALAAAHQADRNDTLVLCLLGQLLEENGSLRRAAEYYKRALVAGPDDGLARHLYEQLRKTLSSRSRGI